MYFHIFCSDLTTETTKRLQSIFRRRFAGRVLFALRLHLRWMQQLGAALSPGLRPFATFQDPASSSHNYRVFSSFFGIFFGMRKDSETGTRRPGFLFTFLARLTATDRQQLPNNK